MEEKVYMARAFFDPVCFPVYQCNTTDEAKQRAFELAEDLARCLGPDIHIDFVEVEPC